MSFPNLDQRAVIDAIREPLLVLAPMGTGKTRTAAAAMRAALETGIEPERILGLTFTNRAAEAMRTALAEAAPKKSHRVQLFNLHGLCTRLLRTEGALADLPPDFGILDEDESAQLLWEFIPQPDRQERYRNKSQEALNAYERFVFQFLMGETTGPTPPPFRMYRDAMHRDGTVDFTGLIARTYRILKTDAAARERWQTRYEWMLVDEVQDINMAEYRVISLLAERHRCLKFFGDNHQTIYEWRFAQPQQVIETFEREFQPRRMALRMNYRCSQALVAATNAIRTAFIPSKDPLPEAAIDHAHSSMELRTYETSRAETEAVVTQISSWRREGIPYHEIAVLARQNRTLIEISSALKAAEIPHLVAEDFDFFRRQEVKDVTAVLEHLVSPFRRHPILRLLRRFGAKAGALERLETETQGTGLHLGYLIRGTAGDPLHPLLEAWERRQVVALDTESTGLDPATSEVIQLALIRLHPSKFQEQGTVSSETIHSVTAEWIRPDGKVGGSFHTHGISDDFLAAHGRNPREVFQKLLQFESGEVLLGHNLKFDLRLIRHQTARLGLDFQIPEHYDTMPLAAKCLSREQLTGLRLEAVASAAGIEISRAHDAAADAETCLRILENWVPLLKETQTARLKLIAGLGSELDLAFRKVIQIFHQAAEKEMECTSLAELVLAIWKILQDSPGHHDYKTNASRTSNIQDLAAVARFLESRHGPISLPRFLEQVALSRRDMMLETGPERVRLLSAHAAKGLEFDAVLLPRLIKPWSGYTDEEARIFYVMLTRARHHLNMTWPQKIISPRGTEQSTEPLKYLAAMESFLPKSRAIPPVQSDA